MARQPLFLLCFAIVLGSLGCSSLPKGSGGGVMPSPSEPGQEIIDLIGLRRELGMDKPRQSLGYDEKRFNSCDVGHGYSSTQNCRERVYAVVNLRLECRDSQGTTSTIHHKLTPISNKRIEWDWAGLRNITVSDRDGYAQVLMVTSRSPKNQRLRLTIGGKFLAMTAGDMHRVVVPGDWCGR